MDAVDRRWLRGGRIMLALIIGVGLGMVLGLTFIERACGLDADLCSSFWVMAGVPTLWATLLAVTLGHFAARLDAVTGYVAACSVAIVAAMLLLPVGTAHALVATLGPAMQALGDGRFGFFVIWGTTGVLTGAFAWWLPRGIDAWLERRAGRQA